MNIAPSITESHYMPSESQLMPQPTPA